VSTHSAITIDPVGYDALAGLKNTASKKPRLDVVSIDEALKKDWALTSGVIDSVTFLRAGEKGSKSYTITVDDGKASPGLASLWTK